MTNYVCAAPQQQTVPQLELRPRKLRQSVRSNCENNEADSPLRPCRVVVSISAECTSIWITGIGLRFAVAGSPQKGLPDCIDPVGS